VGCGRAPAADGDRRAAGAGKRPFLTATEFRLLVELAKRPGQVFESSPKNGQPVNVQLIPVTLAP
jgi:hypothetical protein